MFLATVIASMIVAVAPQGAAPPPPPPPRPQEPQIEIGLHTYRANEAPAGTTSNSGGAEPFTSFISASDSLCQIGGGQTDRSMGTGSSWRVSGRVLSRDGDVFSVQIDWQRQLDHGVRVEGPGESSTRTMRLGDRVLLDSVTPTGPGCDVVVARLEAAMLVKTIYPKLPAGAGINVGGGGGGGRGGGFGGGVTGVTGAVPAGGSGGGRSGGGGGALAAGNNRPEAVARLLQEAADRRAQASGPQFDAATWLVHRQPNGAEDAQYLLIRTAGTGAVFRFEPVAFIGPQGKITVELSGVLAPTPGVGPTMRLSVQLDRHVHVDSAPPQDTRGNSSSTVVVTGPTDVVSFELPSAMEPKGDRTKDLLAGHQFSLRVRLTAVAR